MGVVNNLGTGVKDFFYEPYDGLASDGSLEAFLDGLGKGKAGEWEEDWGTGCEEECSRQVWWPSPELLVGRPRPRVANSRRLFLNHSVDAVSISR